MGMRKLAFVKLTLFLLSIFLAALPPAQAQKPTLKNLRALQKQQHLAKTLSAAGKNAPSVPTAAQKAAGKAATTHILAAGSLKNLPLNQELPTENSLETPVVNAKELQEIILSRQSSSREFFKNKWQRENPREKVDQILQQNKNPVAALKAVWEVEDQYTNKKFFAYFAARYYRENFPTLTPHLRELFKKADQENSRTLEISIIKRIAFIIENRSRFRAFFAPNIPKSGLRLRYTKDIGKMTAASFNAKNLVLSFERKMNPGQFNASIRHVRAKSMFPVGEKALYPVYRYNGPLDYMPNLYRYLINGNHPKNLMTILFDKDARSMAIYNEDRTLWLRITPHEYSVAGNLHIHLNESRQAVITTASGQEVKETVNFNLFIPLEKPAGLPAHHQNEFLYENMILKPLRSFRGNAHVKIIEQSIF